MKNKKGMENTPVCKKRGNPMIRIIICDDDSTYLYKINDNVTAIMKACNIRSRIHTFSELDKIGQDILSSCDIAILDIDFNNKEYTGIDIARELRKYRSDTIIIFVTNFIEYAPEGYEVQAFRYILKDDITSKLEFTLKAALEKMKVEQATFKIQINGELVDIPVKSIMYVESEQHMLTLYAKGMDGSIKKYKFYSTLSGVEKKLENRGFLRVHRSYLVNMAYIKKFHCHGVILNNGTALSVSEKNYAFQKKKYLLWRGR